MSDENGKYPLTSLMIMFGRRFPFHQVTSEGLTGWVLLKYSYCTVHTYVQRSSNQSPIPLVESFAIQ